MLYNAGVQVFKYILVSYAVLIVKHNMAWNGHSWHGMDMDQASRRRKSIHSEIRGNDREPFNDFAPNVSIADHSGESTRYGDGRSNTATG